jgi:NAD(P) transhydrogenase subunit alpha
MLIGIPAETAQGETRVAAVPETVKRMKAAGLDVMVQAGAGSAATFTDEAFAGAGAEIAPSAADLYAKADLVVYVGSPADGGEGASLPGGLRAETVLVGVFAPLSNGELVRALAERGVTSFSLDLMPRVTRAQAMDVLSSMATIAGYKAALIAADELDKLVPMMITAAGTVRPAAALVVGAGVAGLQAIATAKRLGAVVTGVDVRPSAREQVESLGAKFVPMEVSHEAESEGGYATDLGEEFYAQEQQILAPHVRRSDMVITTALIPGRAAPVLITKAMVESMKGGSVIVDLAVRAGGNCSLSEPDKRVVHHGVVIRGPVNLPAAVPYHASVMLARNVAAFIKELAPEGEVKLDEDNEIIRKTMVTRGGEVVNESPRGRNEGKGDE